MCPRPVSESEDGDRCGDGVLTPAAFGSQRDHCMRHEQPICASTDTMILVTYWRLMGYSASRVASTFLRLAAAVVDSREAMSSDEWQGGVLPGCRAWRCQKITNRSQLKSPVE